MADVLDSWKKLSPTTRNVTWPWLWNILPGMVVVVAVVVVVVCVISIIPTAAVVGAPRPARAMTDAYCFLGEKVIYLQIDAKQPHAYIT